jgi:hypothetical protein
LLGTGKTGFSGTLQGKYVASTVDVVGRRGKGGRALRAGPLKLPGYFPPFLIWFGLSFPPFYQTTEIG